MPEPITIAVTNAEAYKDISNLCDVVRRVKSLTEACIEDGRYVESKLLGHLEHSLPDLLDEFDQVSEVVEAELRRLFNILHPPTNAPAPPAVSAPGTAAPAQPVLPTDQYGGSDLAYELIRRRLVGPAGRAKVRAFWDTYWGWDKRHGRKWLRRTLRAGMVPVRSLIDAIPFVGGGIGEAMDVVTDAVEEWQDD